MFIKIKHNLRELSTVRVNPADALTPPSVFRLTEHEQFMVSVDEPFKFKTRNSLPEHVEVCWVKGSVAHGWQSTLTTRKFPPAGASANRLRLTGWFKMFIILLWLFGHRWIIILSSLQTKTIVRKRLQCY